MIKALFFDVFGTVVDWRNSIAAEVDKLAAAKGLDLDGQTFALAWRGRYREAGKLRSRVLNLDLAVAKLGPLLDHSAGGQTETMRRCGRLGFDGQRQRGPIGLERVDADIERSPVEQCFRFLLLNPRCGEHVA